jgi:hypothetical protein
MRREAGTITGWLCAQLLNENNKVQGKTSDLNIGMGFGNELTEFIGINPVKSLRSE